MQEKLKRVQPKPLDGTEPFHRASEPLPFNVLGFWRWYCSDLLSNATRGVVAEFIVAQALGCRNALRTEWDACDFTTHDGIRVEVKSAAHLQTWDQKALSKITFGIAPTMGWDAATNTIATEARRSADVYVFCVLDHKDKSTVDPLDVTQWQFFLLAACVLNERIPTQKSLSFSTLRFLGPEESNYEGLPAAFERVVDRHDLRRAPPVPGINA